VTEGRNKESARRFFKKELDYYERPPKVTSDRLNSYKSVVREESPKTKHIRGKWLNNRAENSHVPIRERVHRMRKFKSPDQAQMFSDRFEFIRHYTKPKQHLLPPSEYRRTLKYRLKVWDRIAQIPLAA